VAESAASPIGVPAKTNNMEKKKVYLASSMEPVFRGFIREAAETLRKKFDVYVPMDNFIPNAWDYPNNEWGLMVFQNDVAAIEDSDYVVVLNYGRTRTTAGCSWEAGYAYALRKKVFVVDVNPCPDEPFVTSLMVENGRYATIEGLKGLAEYDWENLPKTRTMYEQK